MKRKVLCLILCAAMMLSMCTIGVGAEDSELNWDDIIIVPEDKNGEISETVVWEYDYETLTLTIKGTGAIPDSFPGEHPWDDVVETKITRIVVEEGITSIGEYGFARMREVAEVVLPSTVESMSNYVFHQCNELKTLTLPPLEVINAGLLDGSYVENLILPEGVKVIEKLAFANNRRIKTVSLPETLERIEIGAFSGCLAIEELTLPESLIYIGGDAFSGCDSLKTINIPEGVEKINDLTFYGCENLEEIILPENIDLNSWAAFDGCEKLCDEDGYLILNDALLLYTAEVNAEEFVIPDGVKFVGCLFRGSDGWGYGVEPEVVCKKVVFPDSVEAIADYAFSYNSKVEEIVLSDNIKAITDETFYNCTNLKTINLPENLETLGKNAFANCAKLESIEIPAGVAELCEGAFENCAELKEITIGKNVETISLNVFSECMNLTKVHYMGNEKQWNNIDVADGNDVLLTADITFEELLKLLGDVDGDGEITASDALAMRKYLSGRTTAEGINIDLADAFEDGRINAKDLLVIKKILAQ